MFFSFGVWAVFSFVGLDGGLSVVGVVCWRLVSLPSPPWNKAGVSSARPPKRFFDVGLVFLVRFWLLFGAGVDCAPSVCLRDLVFFSLGVCLCALVFGVWCLCLCVCSSLFLVPTLPLVGRRLCSLSPL